MKNTSDMTLEELVAESLARPALQKRGTDIEILKEEVRARGKERLEENTIIELAVGVLDDPEFWEVDTSSRNIVVPSEDDLGL